MHKAWAVFKFKENVISVFNFKRKLPFATLESINIEVVRLENHGFIE